MTTIRDIGARDEAAVAALLVRAFGGGDEAALCERLRADGDVLVELVACDDDGAIAGHVLLSPMDVEGDGRAIAAAALAPLAVDPALQRQGIGAALVVSALDAARARGVSAAFVLGEPGYYLRFGFAADAAAPFEAPFGPPHFMALALVPGALDVAAGRAGYAPAFGLPRPGIAEPGKS